MLSVSETSGRSQYSFAYPFTVHTAMSNSSIAHTRKIEVLVITTRLMLPLVTQRQDGHQGFTGALD